MILYIGERQDEPFITEVGKGVVDEIRMVTEVHTTEQLMEHALSIPYTYLIVNIMCIEGDPDTLIKQLKYIQTHISSNLIIIASGLPTDDPMVQSLYFSGIKNVIITSWFPNIASQCIKYLCGTYHETQVIQENDGETMKLDLKQIYKDDPEILQQLEEFERENEKRREAQEAITDTRKLSLEELFPNGGDMMAQVKEYEEERHRQEESTTLYHQENAFGSAVPYEAIPSDQGAGQPFVQAYSPMEGMENYCAPPNQEQALDMPFWGQMSEPTYVKDSLQGKREELEEKQSKKSKKPIIVTACLCAILLVSIAVPVSYTIINRKQKDNRAQALEPEKKQEEIYTSSTPLETPDTFVVGAVPDGAADEVPTPIMEEDGFTEPEEQDQEPEITLTPIKGQESLDQQKEDSEKQTPKPSKEPEKSKEPKSTKEPEKVIKIKSLILPTTVSVLKGGTYEIDLSYSPSNATETVTWSSSDSSIASVKNGILHAKKNGTVTVTVKTKSGVKKSCLVDVSEE